MTANVHLLVAHGNRWMYCQFNSKLNCRKTVLNSWHSRLESTTDAAIEHIWTICAFEEKVQIWRWELFLQSFCTYTCFIFTYHYPQVHMSGRRTSFHTCSEVTQNSWLNVSEQVHLIFFTAGLGKGSKNQNGNLRWHLPLGVWPLLPPP